MAKYRARSFLAEPNPERFCDQLQPGDELSLIGAFGKVNQLKILESYRYNNRQVYVTDGMGLIYADEVVPVSLPTWKKGKFPDNLKWFKVWATQFCDGPGEAVIPPPAANTP